MPPASARAQPRVYRLHDRGHPCAGPRGRTRCNVDDDAAVMPGLALRHAPVLAVRRRVRLSGQRAHQRLAFHNAQVSPIRRHDHRLGRVAIRHGCQQPRRLGSVRIDTQYAGTMRHELQAGLAIDPRAVARQSTTSATRSRQMMPMGAGPFSTTTAWSAGCLAKIRNTSPRLAEYCTPGMHRVMRFSTGKAVMVWLPKVVTVSQGRAVSPPQGKRRRNINGQVGSVFSAGICHNASRCATPFPERRQLAPGIAKWQEADAKCMVC